LIGALKQIDLPSPFCQGTAGAFSTRKPAKMLRRFVSLKEDFIFFSSSHTKADLAFAYAITFRLETTFFPIPNRCKGTRGTQLQKQNELKQLEHVIVN